MTTTKRIAASLLAALPAVAGADVLGFRIDINGWQQNFDGSVQDGPQSIDVEDTLGLDDDTNTNFGIAFEHPVPLLPNVALRRTELEVSGTNTLNRSFTFDGDTFNVSETVDSDLDLSHTDATFYYEVLDNWISLDLGLTARIFDEGITLATATERAELDIDGTLPMAYAAVRFDLPLSGLYAGGDINAIGYDDSTVADYKINLGYETALGLGVEAGYRAFDIDYEDDDDEQADLVVEGAYLGVFYDF